MNRLISVGELRLALAEQGVGHEEPGCRWCGDRLGLRVRPPADDHHLDDERVDLQALAEQPRHLTAEHQVGRKQRDRLQHVPPGLSGRVHRS